MFLIPSFHALCWVFPCPHAWPFALVRRGDGRLQLFPLPAFLAPLLTWYSQYRVPGLPALSDSLTFQVEQEWTQSSV